MADDTRSGGGTAQVQAAHPSRQPAPPEALEALEQMREADKAAKKFDTTYSDPHWAYWAKPDGGFVISYHNGLGGRGVLFWDGSEWRTWSALPAEAAS